MKKRVILGLSGGVDSSVAALLLLKDGYDVEAVFMRNWDSATNNEQVGSKRSYDEVCEQEQDYLDAKKVADQLGIILHRVDFIDEYWDLVFAYFLDEYKKNRTPNPDILCNNEIKFKAFIKYAKTLKYDYIAMGHYARVDHSGKLPRLFKAIDETKDQSYFLSMLEANQLKDVIFPLGDLKKDEVRQIAKNANLATATKKDSTGICFIGERHFGEFLSNYLPAQDGDMRRLDKTFIKKHHGLMNYTIGQRKGLGIGGSADTTQAWFVVGKDLKTNTLYVEPGEHEYLYSDKAIITDVIMRRKTTKSNYHAKFRYRQIDIPIKLSWISENSFVVEYPQKVKAVTPGQICAIYDGDECIGAGFIDKVFYKESERQYS